MSKLLLVEPDKMLRHAFVVALFPEFEIQVVDSLGDAASKDADVLIVDAAAMQERAAHLTPMIRSVAHWHLPIIWIDNDPPVQVPRQDRCIQLKRPVSRESLRSALAQCLRAETKKSPRRAIRNTNAARDGATRERADVIELVDVVEETTAR